jgi:transcriptional regulator with XRE-family HTH domain
MDNILSDNNFILEDFNPSAIAKNIAEKLKQRRLELNISQEELANRSGVSYGSVKRFEIKYKISLVNLLMIAVVLNATEEFKLLFSKQQYQSIDEVIAISKKQKRKRAR